MSNYGRVFNLLTQLQTLPTVKLNYGKFLLRNKILNRTFSGAPKAKMACERDFIKHGKALSKEDFSVTWEVLLDGLSSALS